jgi:enoyl-CoA hydratase/carnithine racemase
MAMQPVNDPAAPMLLFEHSVAGGRILAEARFNSEPTLNSLSLEMIEILTPALDRWEDDSRVTAVLITGAGDRAFSAGGDIQALYRAIVKNHQAGAVVDDYPFRFFEHEYRLDYRLHTYPKTIVCVGHGIIMGGGLGVFSGSRYRVVTEKSRIALPEVTIGLFPDAGGTWLLRNLPEQVAVFIGLTGSSLNGADALALGLGTHSVSLAEHETVRDRLLEMDWSGDADADDARVRAVLDALPAADMPETQVTQLPDSLSASGTPAEVAQRIAGLEGKGKWIDGGIAAMARGCPTTIGIVVEQLRRARTMSLAEAFQLEMIVATHCANHPDFAEGVRALLIDKDNQPDWRYKKLEDLPEAYVAEHFEAPWPQNPLHDLEETTA